MLQPKSPTGNLDSEIQIIENELAQAVAEAMALRREGRSAGDKLARIKTLSERRKALFQSRTRVFA